MNVLILVDADDDAAKDPHDDKNQLEGHHPHPPINRKSPRLIFRHISFTPYSFFAALQTAGISVMFLMCVFFWVG